MPNAHTEDEGEPTPGRFREDYLGLWVTEDGTKTLRIHRDEAGRLRVAVWQGFFERPLATDLPARWKDAATGAEQSPSALSRLGYLQVELGTENLGTTYDLMFAAESTDAEASGGFLWRAVRASDPVEAVRVFPQGGASYYEAVLGYWDDFVEELRDAEQSWIEPLSTYRIATATEAASAADILRGVRPPR